MVLVSAVYPGKRNSYVSAPGSSGIWCSVVLKGMKILRKRQKQRRDKSRTKNLIGITVRFSKARKAKILNLHRAKKRLIDTARHFASNRWTRSAGLMGAIYYALITPVPCTFYPTLAHRNTLRHTCNLPVNRAPKVNGGTEVYGDCTTLR